MSDWRIAAATAIEKAYLQAKREGKSGAEMVRAIDAAYPFGERAMHPYKVWRKVRFEILYKLRLVDPYNKVIE